MAHAVANLESWHETAAKQAIVDFVARTTDEGSAGYVPPGDRIAVFDNDGTLWCESNADSARFHPQEARRNGAGEAGAAGAPAVQGRV